MTEAGGDSFEEKVASAMDFKRLISPLDETEKQIFVLHFYGGLKKSQIAQIMGVPPANVRARYSRALKKLRASSKNY